jgi:hypothetical protein
MPRYKVAAEGEPVLYDDEIVLVGVKSQLRLHASSSRDTSLPDVVNEVNASQVSGRALVCWRQRSVPC